MAIFSGITAPKKIGGIFGLSCYLLLHDKIKNFIPGENLNKDTPIFMGHGDSDPLVLPQWGKLTAELLKKEGKNPISKFKVPGFMRRFLTPSL